VSIYPQIIVERLKKIQGGWEGSFFSRTCDEFTRSVRTSQNKVVHHQSPIG
jgi:hypothetical protein